MSAPVWNGNVELRIDCGDHYRSVRNPRDAIASLNACWPEKTGKSYAKARKACLAAATGRDTPEHARQCFIEAARAVGILHTH